MGPTGFRAHGQGSSHNSVHIVAGASLRGAVVDAKLELLVIAQAGSVVRSAAQ